jgi:hypothetical protein
MMLELKNDFHNTSVRIRARVGQRLSPRTIQRIQRALCGMDDCLCSGWLGHRGPQPWAPVDISYDGTVVQLQPETRS